MSRYIISPLASRDLNAIADYFLERNLESLASPNNTFQHGDLRNRVSWRNPVSGGRGIFL
jgi:hypothetical protein